MLLMGASRQQSAGVALSPAARVLLHEPAGTNSLKNVHWTFFRALVATAVGKLLVARHRNQYFPTAVGKLLVARHRNK